MKSIEALEQVIGVAGKPLGGPPEGWQPTSTTEIAPTVTWPLTRILKDALYRMPCDTMHDSRMGVKVLDAIGTANGVIELEDEWYAWLKPKMEQHLPKLWATNAIAIFEALCENGQAETRAERRRKK